MEEKELEKAGHHETAHLPAQLHLAVQLASHGQKTKMATGSRNKNSDDRSDSDLGVQAVLLLEDLDERRNRVLLRIRIVTHLQTARPLARVVHRVHVGVHTDHVEASMLDLLRDRLVVLL